MRKFRFFLAPAFFIAAVSQAACVDSRSRDDGRNAAVQTNDDGGVRGCTFTQGFWKNHPEDWPVAQLSLGGRVYTQAELLAIFNEPVSGNGLVSLSHQLIAAKLNVAAGAPDATIAATIIAADLLIGSLVTPPIGTGYLHPSLTSALNDELDDFNRVGPEDCEPPPACGDGTLDEGEACDDGNTTNGDGCSSTCEVEETPPACGDETLDEGEACDDGNTTNGDGCSSTCEIEETPPACGDGTLDAGEQCDDGNTTNGDGCSAGCRIELTVPECGNGIVEAGEHCDDGNQNNNDACSTTCHVNT